MKDNNKYIKKKSSISTTKKSIQKLVFAAAVSIAGFGCASAITRVMSDEAIANAVTEPSYEKSPVLKTPKEFGLNYEDVSFQANDGVQLSGWLVKGGTEKIIIISHFGIVSSRSGYTPEGKGAFKPYPEEIEYLKIAKHLVDNGYSVLMYDLRNHGKSGKGTNQWITGGVDEYKDVLAAVQFVSTHSDYQDSKIGLLSLCMGSVSTVYAYGIDGGLQDNNNIKALIAVQPQDNLTFLKSFGFSKEQIADANKLNIKRGGVDFNVSFVPQLKSVSVPTMVVQAKKDPWTDIETVKGYYNELQVEKELYWLENADKRFDAYNWFTHSPEKMLEWFDKFVK